jgi:hypothetical protein
MPFERIIFRVHAIQRMFSRGISETDIRDVLENGEIIEENPDDSPYPSRLILGFVDRRPLHVAASDDPVQRATVVITVYVPDEDKWDKKFQRRTK